MTLHSGHAGPRPPHPLAVSGLRWRSLDKCRACYRGPETRAAIVHAVQTEKLRHGWRWNRRAEWRSRDRSWARAPSTVLPRHCRPLGSLTEVHEFRGWLCADEPSEMSVVVRYFSALSRGDPLPVKDRIEMPMATQKTDTGLTQGLLKVLHKQV